MGWRSLGKILREGTEVSCVRWFLIILGNSLVFDFICLYRFSFLIFFYWDCYRWLENYGLSRNYFMEREVGKGNGIVGC